MIYVKVLGQLLRGFWVTFDQFCVSFTHLFCQNSSKRIENFAKAASNYVLQNNEKKKHLIVLRALLLLQSVISISFWPPFIGNPNFQDILNWILQILHYYCRKQHKNIKNSRIIEQNLVLSFFLLSVYCDLCFLSPSSTAEFFHFLNETSQVIICAVYSFVFCFENDFLQV